MKIQDNKTIRELQGEFKNKYPYLKIEFYKNEHSDYTGSPSTDMLNTSLYLKDIRSVHTEKDLNIRDDMSAAELEKEFHDSYGMNIQVFRKSGGLWLQTIATDDWTLGDLNKRGKISAEGYKV